MSRIIGLRKHFYISDTDEIKEKQLIYIRKSDGTLIRVEFGNTVSLKILYDSEPFSFMLNRGFSGLISNFDENVTSYTCEYFQFSDEGYNINMDCFQGLPRQLHSMPIFIIDYLRTELVLSGKNIFYLGDELPSGDFTRIHISGVKILSPESDKTVYILTGLSATCKSTFGKILSEARGLSVYETDISPILPEVIDQDIIVVGRRSKFSLEQVIPLCGGKRMIHLAFSKS